MSYAESGFAYEEEVIEWSDPRETDSNHVILLKREPRQERFIPPIMNPRLSYCNTTQKPHKKKSATKANSTPRSGNMTLYHFTAAAFLQAILKDGFNCGTVATSKRDYFNNATWFTESPTGGMPCEHDLDLTHSKNRMRLQVQMNLADRNLWRWNDLAGYLKLPTQLVAILNVTGGNMGHLWWVYVNHPVPASHITQITDMKDGVDITDLLIHSSSE